MAVVAIAMCKDEADVVQQNIFHLLEEDVDEFLIADNLSSDGTRDLLADIAAKNGNVHIVDDPEIAYYQSRKMTSLAHQAHELYQADWIIPFDLDELWYAHADKLGAVLRNLPAECDLVHVPIINHFASALDLPGDNPFETMVWRQPAAQEMPKVAARFRGNMVIHQGNHAVSFDGRPAESWTLTEGIELRHFPYRTFDRMVRKARNGGAAYAATDLPEGQGQHWRGYARIIEEHGEDTFRRDVFERYFWFLSPIDAGLIRDPAPYRRWR